MQVAWQQLVWAQGMLLHPQHFQTLQQSWETENRCLRRVFHYPHWGVIDIQHDPSALLSATLKLTCCEVIFPNGYYLRHPVVSSAILHCDLSGETQSSVKIYVCLPLSEHTQNIPGYTQSPQNQKLSACWEARFISQPDRYDPNQQQEIIIAEPRVSLRTCPTDDCIALPVMQVKRVDDQSWQLDQSFIAPVLQIGKSEALGAVLGRCLQAVTLHASRLQQGKSVGAGTISSIQRCNQHDLIAICLVQALATLKHLQRHHPQSPFQLYQVLSELVDQLCMHLRVDAKELSAYQQHNLTEIFNALEAQLNSVLAAITPLRYQRLGFTVTEQAVLVLENLDPQRLKQSQAYLAVAYQSDELAWVKTFNKQVKVAADDSIAVLMTTALSGVEMQHCVQLPSGFPCEAGYQYFSLDQRGDAWQQVLQRGSIAVYRAAHFIEARIELLLLDEDPL